MTDKREGAWGAYKKRRWGVTSWDDWARKERNWARVGNLLALGIMFSILHGQAGATTGAAALDHEATLVGGHADTEAVSVATLGFFGLVGSLGHGWDYNKRAVICHGSM